MFQENVMWDSLTGRNVDTLALQGNFARIKVAAIMTKHQTLTGVLNESMTTCKISIYFPLYTINTCEANMFPCIPCRGRM